MLDNTFKWQGRIDPEPESFRWHQVMNSSLQASHHKGYVLLGFCCDLGVKINKGRTGAAKAPNAIRNALANLPYRQTSPLYDIGNICSDSNDLSVHHQILATQVTDILAKEHIPIILGGGHEVAYGSWLGYSQYHQREKNYPPKLGIINFDAHFDLRDSHHVISSGTPFHQIAMACQSNNWPFSYACLGISEASNTVALFNTASALNVLNILDHEMTFNNLTMIMNKLDHFIASCDHIYLSIDMDVFPCFQAPGVSAPSAYGVGIEIIEPLLKHIKQSNKIKLIDIAEMNPDFDRDNQTARLAARLIHTLTL